MGDSCLSIGISKENIKYNKPAGMGLTRLPSAENSPERNRQKNNPAEKQKATKCLTWKFQNAGQGWGVLTGHCISDICTAASWVRFCYGFSIPTKCRQHFNRVNRANNEKASVIPCILQCLMFISNDCNHRGESPATPLESAFKYFTWHCSTTGLQTCRMSKQHLKH